LRSFEVDRLLQLVTLEAKRRHEGHHWVDLAMVGPLAVAYPLCARCRDSDPERRKLTAVLQQRYRQEPMQTGAGRCEDTAKN
jgi:hypothetical protein